MDVYRIQQLAYGLVSLVNLITVIIIYYFNRKQKKHMVNSLLIAIAFLGWSFTAFLQSNVFDRAQWIFTNSLSYIFILSMPYVFLKFVLQSTITGSTIYEKYRKKLDGLSSFLLIFSVVIFFYQFVYNYLGVANYFTMAIQNGTNGYGPFIEIHGPLWILFIVIIILIMVISLIFSIKDVYTYNINVTNPDSYLWIIIVSFLIISTFISTIILRYIMRKSLVIDLVVVSFSLAFCIYAFLKIRYIKTSYDKLIENKIYATGLKPGIYGLDVPMDDMELRRIFKRVNTLGRALRGLSDIAVSLNLSNKDEREDMFASSTIKLAPNMDLAVLKDNIDYYMHTNRVLYIYGIENFLKEYPMSKIKGVLEFLDIIFKALEVRHEDNPYVFIVCSRELLDNEVKTTLRYFITTYSINSITDRRQMRNSPDRNLYGIIRYSSIERERLDTKEKLKEVNMGLEREFTALDNMVNILSHEFNTSSFRILIALEKAKTNIGIQKDEVMGLSNLVSSYTEELSKLGQEIYREKDIP